MGNGPDPRSANLRTMKMDPSMGKDVRDTKVLDGMASRSSAEKETNETVQYVNKGGTAGSTWGGENKGL